MSEFAITFFVKFIPPQPQLKILLSGICRGELGAYIEERVEPFGASAESAAQRMLDDWDSRNNVPSFEKFTKTDAGFEFMMTSGYAVEKDIAMLTELFILCGATVSHTPNYVLDTP